MFAGNTILYMKRVAPVFFSFVVVVLAIMAAVGGTGCANIVPPSGGPRDTLPPILIASLPQDSTINYTGNRIVLTFDEYVNIENALENVLISPTPKNNPIIDYKLRNITVRLRDTLEPNTTYSINFGNAIKDVNEGNIYKDFTYVFSTGPYLDDNTLTGRVLLAETGKADSTLIAVLHRNTDDSAAAKERPRFITRLDGRGNFQFRNLPSGTYALYAIPNEYSKRYDDTTRPFAFADRPIELDSNVQNVLLMAFQKPKVVVNKPATTAAQPTARDKLLRYSSVQGSLDILEPLRLVFSKPITTYDSTKVVLTDNEFRRVANYTISADTNQTTFDINYPWPADAQFNLLIEKEAFADSTGLTLARNDTLRITTKKEDEYGSLKIRFNNLDLTKNPVLQLVTNDVIALTAPLTQRDWTRKLVKPGTYQVRILYDTNKNGKWDTGDFLNGRRQPEVVRDLDINIDVRANWDNEKEITLQ
jgi:uncharacterized protein (DUF2141 family)